MLQHIIYVNRKCIQILITNCIKIAILFFFFLGLFFFPLFYILKCVHFQWSKILCFQLLDVLEVLVFITSNQNVKSFYRGMIRLLQHCPPSPCFVHPVTTGCFFFLLIYCNVGCTFFLIVSRFVKIINMCTCWLKH